jgi:hypothetical protein
MTVAGIPKWYAAKRRLHSTAVLNVSMILEITDENQSDCCSLFALLDQRASPWQQVAAEAECPARDDDQEGRGWWCGHD